MYFYKEETPGLGFRWNTYGVEPTKPKLQQEWIVREGPVSWTEWRDVPIVCEAPRSPRTQKVTLTTSATMD